MSRFLPLNPLLSLEPTTFTTSPPFPVSFGVWPLFFCRLGRDVILCISVTAEGVEWVVRAILMVCCACRRRNYSFAPFSFVAISATCCARGCVDSWVGISVPVGAFGDVFTLLVQTPVPVTAGVRISHVHSITTEHLQVPC